MVSSLDDASIDLQNVNNKFMALSNSQFIESRVYDDDVEVKESTEEPKEPPKPVDPSVELEKLKQGLKVLESMHEPLHILHDTDSESDTEDEDAGRLILKPKDLYADRPLPYIIGSTAWKSKWHAGLLPDDSDTESSVSKPDREMVQYSDSEPEITNIQTDKPDTNNDRTVSTTSSELVSERDVSPVKPSPSDVAAELARRLGGQMPTIPDYEPEYTPPNPVTRKVYRPEQPITSTVFADEPPPLDAYSDEESQEDDIFAELHKSKPYANKNLQQSRVTQDLFGGLDQEKEDDSIFNDFEEPQKPAIQRQYLNIGESEPELFVDTPKPKIKQDTTSIESGSIKKPVGGISLFGTNKGTEIGAAILKRNRRQSSTDEDTGNEEVTKNIQEDRKSKEKDIFDDLFAKSIKDQKKVENKIGKIEKEQKEIKKVDLFSDNFFDDIDDIFTTNITKVPIKESTKNKKSLFDDDDDDLFSDISVAKSTKQEITNKITHSDKSIFDSEDELFSEKIVEKTVIDTYKDGANNASEFNVDKIIKQSKVFDDSDILNTKNDVKSSISLNPDNNDQTVKSVKTVETCTYKPQTTNIGFEDTKLINDNLKSSPSLFDDDEDDNIFSSKPTVKTSTDSIKVDNIDKANTITKSLKKSIFGDSNSEDESDLFSGKTEFSRQLPNLKEIYKANSESDDGNEENRTALFTKINFEKKNDNNPHTEPNTLSEKLENNNKEIVSKSDENRNLKTTNTIKPVEKESLLFDNDWEDNLLVKRNEIPRNKPVTVKSVLFDDEPDDDIFNTKQTKEKDFTSEDVGENHQNILSDDLKDHLFAGTNKNFANTTSKENNSMKKNISNVLNSDSSKENIQINMSKTLQYKNEEDNTKSQVSDDDTLRNKSFTEKQNVLKNNEIADESETQMKQQSTSSILETKHESIENTELNVNKNVSYESEITDQKKSFLKDDNLNDNNTTGALFTQEQISVFNKQDVFSDLFSEPPEFEKSKEPKKSKNVNALFDDDSDDEALFFKKNDPTLDEKPDVISPLNENRLFGIFHDEPPAMDIDFIDNSNKLLDDNLFSDSGLFAQKSIITDTKMKPDVVKKTNMEPPDETKLITETEIKKPIGKLKTMNFNIDVNALLPGASPKKVKGEEQADGSSKSIKSEETVNIKNSEVGETESKIIKSVSFEGDPDSSVLDNKLSKERAKIQVKRRPSTRRARKEAARKSAIDFGDDTTDNSSSIDDPPKIINLESNIKQHIENETPKIADKTNGSKVDPFDSNIKYDIESNIPKEVKSKVVYVLHDEDIFTNINTNQTLQKNEVSNIVDVVKSSGTYNKNEHGSKTNVDNEENIKSTEIISSVGKTSSTSAEEDIGTKSLEKETKDKVKSKYNIVNSVGTIENTSEITSITKVKKSIFDDLSDDENELFNKSKPKTKDIFDSDSEGELFGKKNIKERKRIEVKKTLFSEDEDDDLFGAKANKTTGITEKPARQTVQTAREIVPKPTEPVFEDPLSLFGGDDD